MIQLYPSLHSNNTLRRVLSLSVVFISTHVHADTNVAPNDLYEQIVDLQSRMNIKVLGLERIQNEEKIVTRGNLEQQIEQLLTTFNHIVSRNNKGEIERIVIVNKKQKSAVQNIVLPTSHQGNHYMVSAALSGDGSLWETMELVIDTGADIVVLPESMINRLGMKNTNFSHQAMQTANGTTDAKVGSLHSIKLAGETIENVQVAFIPDKQLGPHRLLGMSAFNRYQINIDDQSQSISLTKK